MTINKLLVANRGEIAVRIVRAAAELGIETVAVYSPDDAAALHVHRADTSHELTGSGAGAYLDGQQIIAVARALGCDALHPGYGFLSESADFAEACGEAGVTFVGPTPATLRLFGDKSAARSLAERVDIPTLYGTNGPTTLDDARAFRDLLGPGASVMLKAVAGGGGRGMRMVGPADELDAAFERCSSEAMAGFGNGDLYVEQLIDRARHIEIQIVGDGTGAVSHLGERECSLQRRHQKLVEIAPSPSVSAELRDRLTHAAVRIASSAEVKYRGVGTIEFLVDASDRDDGNPFFAFIEANARLQVEHTVTEEVTGVDLVQTQLAIAGGQTLAELGLTQSSIPPARGYAVQLRVNMEQMQADGTTRPTGGTLTAFETPSGRGLRTDTFGYSGYRTSVSFDSLLAKVIAHSATPDHQAVLRRADRALAEFRIEGIGTNVSFLRALIGHQDVAAKRVYTRFVDDHVAELVDAANNIDGKRFLPSSPAAGPATAPVVGSVGAAAGILAGAQIDANDPLAVLSHGKSTGGATPAEVGPAEPAATATEEVTGPEGSQPVSAPLQGTIVSISIAQGDSVHAGAEILVMEAMKMEHVITADRNGIVQMLAVEPGDTVFEGRPLAFITEADVGEAEAAEEIVVDLDHIRPDLAEVHERHGLGYDEQRPDSVARRRKTGHRTARENLDDLIDPDTFVEYGAMVVAAQRRRRELDDLIRNTPADGMITGVGSINGELFGPDDSQCAILSYDYTVLAGTQGLQNHRKKDRMFEIAADYRLPVVLFAEGGGGRPGDTDGLGMAGLDCWAFTFYGRLSGLVPLVGITTGRCFAGNAALLGCCDVVIATEGSNIGMGGPAMIEGGGLGIFRPEEVGPLDVQVENGVVDIAVQDEEEAVAVAKKYLSYFQGPTDDWECADQRRLRSIIPENRLRIYDVREVIETIVDTDSLLEMRKGFGLGMITAFARIEGRPVGVVANNPEYLAGAIDSDGADKASRFMQLCDAFDIPLVFLADTPGIMVGPEVEKTALVRHAARMFVTSASLTVPFFTVILRKAYGLGAQAMAGGSFKAPFFTLSWPTGEFGGMGLEGAVKLGYRKELEAEEDPVARKELYDDMVDRMYRHGKALNTATHFEIDDVIDPVDTRHRLLAGLRSAPTPPERHGKKRPCIDTW